MNKFIYMPGDTLLIGVAASTYMLNFQATKALTPVSLPLPHRPACKQYKYILKIKKKFTS